MKTLKSIVVVITMAIACMALFCGCDSTNTEPHHFGKWSDPYLAPESGWLTGYTYLQNRVDTNDGYTEIRVVVKTR